MTDKQQQAAKSKFARLIPRIVDALNYPMDPYGTNYTPLVVPQLNGIVGVMRAYAELFDYLTPNARVYEAQTIEISFTYEYLEALAALPGVYKNDEHRKFAVIADMVDTVPRRIANELYERFDPPVFDTGGHDDPDSLRPEGDLDLYVLVRGFEFEADDTDRICHLRVTYKVVVSKTKVPTLPPSNV